MSPPLLLWPVTLTFCSSLSHETRDLPQPFSPPLQTWTQSCVVLTFNSTELILTFCHILSAVGSKEANFRAAARYCCFDGAFNFPRSKALDTFHQHREWTWSRGSPFDLLLSNVLTSRLMSAGFKFGQFRGISSNVVVQHQSALRSSRHALTVCLTFLQDGDSRLCCWTLRCIVLTFWNSQWI